MAEQITRAELAAIDEAQTYCDSCQRAFLTSFQILRDAKIALGNLQLSFLKKVLSIGDGEICETLGLAEPELSSLLHRRRNAGVWSLEEGAPNFRIVKDADAIKIEIVDTEDREATQRHAAYVAWMKSKAAPVPAHIAKMRRWWRENPR
jgi:hypothetical protein